MARSKKENPPAHLAFCAGLTLLVCLLAGSVDAQTLSKTKAAVAATKVAPVATQKAAPIAVASAPAAAPSRAPASLDPNRAVEVRGQSRTLSMMLVLKNGKENINFIRVRKDYKDEIHATEF